MAFFMENYKKLVSQERAREFVRIGSIEVEKAIVDALDYEDLFETLKDSDSIAEEPPKKFHVKIRI